MSLELKKRYNHIVYTLKHKIAFLQTEKQIRGKNTLRGYLHDLDKPFLYLALWLDMKQVQKIHRSYSKHHVKNNLKKSKEDLIDTIIDWECARITKPDKPLNAYQTLMKFYPEHQDVFLPLIKELLPHQVPQKKPVKILKDKRELYFADHANIHSKTYLNQTQREDKQR